VKWLWPRFLARGKLSLLDGDPEMGKSLLAIDLIARLSRGAERPDGSPGGPPVTSVLFSAEDTAADTIRPRAEAAGADLNRLVVPRFRRVPRLPDDVGELEQLVRDCEAGLVVFDPLMAFLAPNVPANLDQYVRLALTPLADLAGRTGCTMWAVRHLGKQPRDRAVYLGQGNMAIVGAVRTALLVGAHPAEAGGRVLTVSKSNVDERPTALGYRVVKSPAGPPVIQWTGPVDLTADGLCRRKGSAGLKARDRAVDWLKRELAGGPRKAADLYAAAAEAGIPERTLERAKAELPAKSHRTWDHKHDRGEWYWYDPDAAWPKKAPFEKPWELPPLE
jgi:hypothetical protein